MSKVYAIISDIDEFIEGVCKTLEEVEKCCSRCNGCDLSEITDGEFYCASIDTPCNEIMKCPWSV